MLPWALFWVVFRRTSLVCLIIFLGLVLAVKVLAALADPDTLSVASVTAYSGVLEAGDLLVIVEYDVAYAALPAETITDSFVARFLVDGAEVNAVNLVSFNDRGWGVGIFSFYWDDTAVSTASIEFENTNGETYKVVLQGKHTAFVDPPKVEVTGVTWRDAAETKPLLQQDIADLAQALENNAAWVANEIDLVASSSGHTALTTTGEDYFARAIPNLSAMVPDLFATSLTTPEFFERTHGRSAQDSLNTFWDGTPIGDGFTAFADLLEMPESVIKALIGFFILCAVAWIVSVKADSVEMGVMSTPFMLAILTAGSFFQFELAALLTFLGIMLLGWTIWLRRAN